MQGRKKAWDIVPDLSEARSRSMKQLTALATSVVKDVLGPSPQEEKAVEAEADFQRRLTNWRADVEAMREMSDEEYEKAVWHGRPGPAPERGSQRKDDLDAWLRQKISDRLLGKIDAVLMELIGIESSYGGSTIRLKSGGSLFGSRLTERAKAIATELADKWVTENCGEAMKGMKNIEGVRQFFSYEMENAVKNAISARISIVAKQRAESISIEVLEAAVDQAMFDAYPVLRRMDAAERLGAKPEPDAA